MADKNVDIGQLIKWQNSVKQELDAVEVTLDEVAKVGKECSGDDTIYGIFQKLGEEIGNAYVGLTKVFKDTMEGTNHVIDMLKKSAANIGQMIQNVADKFSL